ncbi:hypothetical protein MPER_02190, partial [Moniliophthora perniciosa FA553]
MPGDVVIFQSKDGGQGSLLSSLLAEETIELKSGAQVMLIRNVDDKLVNGVVGKVLGFYRQDEVASLDGPAGDPFYVRRVKLDHTGHCPVVEHKDRERIPLSMERHKPDPSLYPLISFLYPDCDGVFVREAVLVKPVEFNVQHGIHTATRLQIPLALAWAMSIHKSQGMMIHRL